MSETRHKLGRNGWLRIGGKPFRELGPRTLARKLARFTTTTDRPTSGTRRRGLDHVFVAPNGREGHHSLPLTPGYRFTLENSDTLN